VVIVVIVLKPELTAALPGFLRRSLEFEALGVKAKISAAESQQVAAGNEISVGGKLPTKQVVAPSPRAAVSFIEQALRSAAANIPQQDRDAVLIRELAVARVDRGHEFVYNRIFGSQILGLKRLNEATRATVDQAREFFKPYAEKYPAVYSNYGFEGWLGFLTNTGLVVQNGHLLEITDIGRDFLHYLTEWRLSDDKPW
jgi:hypothetical protein